MDEMIQRLIKDLREIILEGVNEDEKEVVLVGFVEELTENIEGKYKLVIEYSRDNYSKILAYIKKDEIFNYTKEQKFIYFKYRKFRNIIEEASQKSFIMAQDFLKSKTIEPDYEKKKSEILQLFDNYKNVMEEEVEEKNFYEWHLSETVLDLDYAGEKTDKTSLRLMRLMREKI